MTPIDTVLIVWFIATGLSAAYVAWDAWTNNPQLTIMRWGWLLITLYTGPIGAALYLLSCKEPRPGQHETFIAPRWKQALGSTIHCLAGDATGIIVAAAISMALRLPTWLDLISEYVFGFAFGLFIFQALFMQDMLGGSYLMAVRRTLLPEWLSMNALMGAMVPVMVILMGRNMTTMDPASLRFWGVMSLATLAGLVVAYPVNWWLVATGLKHGMGTVRALGTGGHSLAAERALITAKTGEVPGPTAETTRAARAVAAPGTPGRASIAGQDYPSHLPAEGPAAGSHGEQAQTPKVSRPQVAAVSLLTLLALAAGLLLAARFGDLTVRAAMGQALVDGSNIGRQLPLKLPGA
ncbi:MAG: DUF4396 domain-containing protein [Ardenticatenaceae bacterium]|nr:DUF4396 domain-containing protein [Ardenticatenaceae bacterium]